MSNPVITPLDRFIIIAFQWFLAMEVTRCFLFLIIFFGFDDPVVETARLGIPYCQALGKAVPVSRRLSRHPAFLDYIIRLFVWAGILLPPPLALIVLLLQLDLGLTIMTFIISKFPKIDTFTASLSFGTTLVQFLVRYIFLLLGIIDIFRCFILVALVSFIGIQLLKNLIDLADGYLDGGVLRQSDFKVYRTVGIIYRIPVLINKFGTFIAIMFLGASSVFFSYIVIRLNPIIPAAFLFLGGLGVLITVFVQMLVCNFGVHINEMSKNLLDKYNRGLGNVGDARKRREMARWVKSLEPLALYVGVGELSIKGGCVYSAKSGKLVHKITPIVVALGHSILVGFVIFLRMSNPVITPIGRFIIIILQWILAMEVIRFFLFSMLFFGFDDPVIDTGRLGSPYCEELEKGM
ncbi:hypothetical protein Fcan01_27629 [Folsomia candida]|uniref:Uncharacterized protein n=1 Tax=Folsomia candida TaxID=158441 RepID=A0A226CYD0_FOLCA|nr:hypothetical protein Fcan01_27629 [Folsomia candida]